MALKEDIQNKVRTIISENFTISEINYIPKVDDPKLTFGNTGLKFKATVLFIDMRGSTKVLNRHNKTTVAKLHMAFFHVIVKIANSLDGNVRSFNGDSALVFFHGNKNPALSNAVKCAMQIRYMLTSREGSINSQLKRYSELDFGIGIDFGEILCTKVGIGGQHNRDLFWIGNSVNKSTVLGNKGKKSSYIFISKLVYDNLLDWAKYGNQPIFNEISFIKPNMWNRDNCRYNDKTETCYSTEWEMPL